MKEFDLNINEPEVKESQEKLVGHLKPHKGHTVFKYNKKTAELSKAVFDQIEEETSNKRITIEEDCVYVSALNVKNAIKRLAKHYGLKVKFK